MHGFLLVNCTEIIGSLNVCDYQQLASTRITENLIILLFCEAVQDEEEIILQNYPKTSLKAEFYR